MKKSLTIFHLPENMKEYELVMSDKSTYLISSIEKAGILRSKSQFIELRSGEVINKAFIVVFRLNREGTRKNFYELPETKRKQLAEKISDEIGQKLTIEDVPDWKLPYAIKGM